MPVKDLLEFILYIVPGFVALELYRASYPAKERNQFAQISWSIILGVLIFTFTKWVDENFLENVLQSQKEGFPSSRFIFSLLFVAFVTGGGMILLHFLRFQLSTLHNKLSFIAPDPQSIWAKINLKTNKDWAVIFLNDGSIYIGWISLYTYDPNTENQDFLLSKARRVDEKLNAKYIIDGQGVYLNTRDVKRIEFVKGVKKINKYP